MRFDDRPEFLIFSFALLFAGGMGGCAEPKVETSEKPGESVAASKLADRGDASASRQPANPSEPSSPQSPTPGNGGPRSESPPGDFGTKTQKPTRNRAQTPQQVFRPSDNRPRHDDDRLAKVGIRKYVSKRLILYTDIDPKIARRLPAFVDKAYKAWVAYFGELPPTRERSEFQVTGYIMADKPLFERAGLVPRNLRPFDAGRHRGYEFWMFEHKSDYYRRHLMLHEATHCFMYAVRDSRFAPWYMEGMAEFFGTHHTDAKGATHFGVMAGSPAESRNLGRIELVQNDVRDGKPRSIADVRKLGPGDFNHPRGYAWSWALCKFLDGHPRYGERFRQLGRVLSAKQFQREVTKWLESEKRLPTEWTLFAGSLSYGYDQQRAAIDVQPGESLSPASPAKQFDLATNRGWQSSGVRVEKGKSYSVAARGKFIIAEKPKPWICEPQGVSIFYNAGRPLGMVVAMIRPDAPAIGVDDAAAPEVIPVGRGARFQAATSGTLYFRVNDFWSQLENNTGALKLRINAVQP